MSEDFTFFYGVASGSSRKALRKMEEPNIMVNYATQNNGIWEGIDNLMIDSGGYSFMKGKGEYETSDEDYLSYIYEHQPEYFVLRDYPCEPDILSKFDRTVKDHIRMTANKHRHLLKILRETPIDSQPISVIQGWRLEDYMDCIDLMEDNDLLTEYVGIGSVCRRHQSKKIKNIILKIRDRLPEKKLHAFGVKTSVLRYTSVVDTLNSADSLAYDYNFNTMGRISGTEKKSWKDSVRSYLDFKQQINEILHTHENQRDLRSFDEVEA